MAQVTLSQSVATLAQANNQLKNVCQDLNKSNSRIGSQDALRRSKSLIWDNVEYISEGQLDELLCIRRKRHIVLLNQLLQALKENISIFQGQKEADVKLCKGSFSNIEKVQNLEDVLESKKTELCELKESLKSKLSIAQIKVFVLFNISLFSQYMYLE
mmetsp:Transcript_4408/g.5913  ORF Transcript_4408/g.5913 Transcript_4408/m.5913 type:complete len:158 (+) Transcript_4408:155-628(+)